MPLERTKNFMRERLKPVKSCAVGSFRTVTTKKHGVRGKKAKRLITVCCPAGQWMPRKKHCKVGMITQSVSRGRSRPAW